MTFLKTVALFYSGLIISAYTAIQQPRSVEATPSSFKQISSLPLKKYSNSTFLIPSFFWADGKIEPHPLCYKGIDSLALLLNKHPEISVEISTRDSASSKKLCCDRSKFIKKRLEERYFIKNNIDVNCSSDITKNNGLFLRFYIANKPK